MKNTIMKEISKIEHEYHVKVIYCVEAGSRIWGYSSEESDYDIRFIYVHNVNQYLSVHKPEDVITYSNEVKMEYQGWDLFKSMNLFYRSNPSLFEWLFSPIIYIEGSPIIETLREYIKQYYSLKRLGYHYLNMAKGNLKGDKQSVKDYLHSLRGVLSTGYMVDKNQLPPLSLKELVDQINTVPASLQSEVHTLIKRLSDKKPIEIPYEMKVYINEHIVQLEQTVQELEDSKIPVEHLNKLIWKQLAI